jgi:integrase
VFCHPILILVNSAPVLPVLEVVPKAQLVNVGENLYRVQRPGDRPGKPTGAYYALVKRGGKQFRRSLKTKDRKLAERRLTDLRKKVGNLKLSPDSNLSFEKTAERWMAVTDHTLKPRSCHRRRTSLTAVKPYFVGLAIKNLTTAHCEKWLIGRGRVIAPQTFAHELSLIKNVFNYAIERGLILSNPAEHIKRRTIPQAKVGVPKKEHFRSLVEAIRKSDGRPDSQRKAAPAADLVELMAYSGMRVGEATSLRWRDINFENDSLVVTGGEDGTKNNETRTVPMTTALRELLLKLRDERQPQQSDLVIPIKSAKTAINRACKKMGLPHFHHHDFRHFFATTCIESGVDVPTISRWLGHKDGGALAMRVYGHLRQEHSAVQIKRVSFDDPTCEPAPENVLSFPGTFSTA